MLCANCIERHAIEKTQLALHRGLKSKVITGGLAQDGWDRAAITQAPMPGVPVLRVARNQAALLFITTAMKVGVVIWTINRFTHGSISIYLSSVWCYSNTKTIPTRAIAAPSTSFNVGIWPSNNAPSITPPVTSWVAITFTLVACRRRNAAL
jgi:hypothetical protein